MQTITESTVNNKVESDSSFSAIQIGMGLMIVGASAGLTLYTKKTSALLSQMDKLKSVTTTINNSSGNITQSAKAGAEKAYSSVKNQ